jgi:hypothetical protein
VIDNLNALKKFESAGFSREQASALVDFIYECIGLNQYSDGTILNTKFIVTQQFETTKDSTPEIKPEDMVSPEPQQSELQADPRLSICQLFGKFTMSLFSGLKPIKALIAWVVFFQIVMEALGYYFRGYIRTGFDVLIAIGLYGNVFFLGILFLVFSSRGNRRTAKKKK